MTELIAQVNHETQEVGAHLHGHTLVPIEPVPGTPPFLRQKKRSDYFQEYFDFEKDGYKNTLKAVFYFGLGLITLQAFPPGGLLMIAMAARYQDIAHWDLNIVRNFGKTRSLVLVD
ncbi:hypothetical protein HUU53_02115 [Candidatus Micrarchaeota archaeon]|nr:hypothetical protein [Candidatus Micrarchaeota archaeon]